MTAPEPTRPADEHTDAVALDLDAIHETICDKFTGMAEVQQAADLLVAEVRRLAALCIPLTDLAQELDLSRQNLHHSRAMSSAHFERAEREKARAESAEAEVVTLRARLAEAEALHWKVGGACSHCSQRSDYAVAWPCETAVALADGVDWDCGQCWVCEVRAAVAEPTGQEGDQLALRREIAADPLTRPVAPTDTEATP